MTLDREAIIERIDPRSSERDLLNLLLDVAEATEALRVAIPSAWNDLMVNLSQRKVVDKALDRLEAAIKGAE